MTLQTAIQNTNSRNRICFLSFLMVIAIIKVTGCSNPAPGRDCGDALPNTISMLHSWSVAGDYRQRSERYDDEEDAACIDRADLNEDCGALANLNQAWSIHHWAKRINMIPIRTCNATVWNLVGNPSDATYVREPNFDDDDGDGIPNYWESYLGTNPCFADSFGCNADSDGVADYDGDDDPDGTDEWPICNMQDPANMQTDCV